MKTKGNLLFGIILIGAIILFIVVGPMDYFCHGFYCNEISFNDILPEDRLGNIDLSQDYETIFCPQKKHFAGFEINLINQPDDNQGNLLITICELSGKEIETVSVDLSEVAATEWYMVYTTANYRNNQDYIVRFHAENCTVIPYLQIIDDDYLPDESRDNHLLLAYAYAESTFTFQEKVLFTMFLLALLIGLYGEMVNHNVKKQTRTTAVVAALIVMFTWNYMYNTFDRNAYDGDDTWFEYFQADSESLVTRVIESYRSGVQQEGEYGLGTYSSQFGLQGKIFRRIAKIMDEDYLENLYLLCSLATATVLVLIAYLLGRKYNKLLGCCFGITFMLSPWIVCFARNLYWVEFTWFLPMLTGLICSLKLHDRKIRVGCYAAAFVTVAIKCLCGYEYITVVMLGLIAFLTVDLLEKCIVRDKAEALLLLRTIVILGVMALLGFAVAICLHANLRGDGDIWAGIQSIYENDVLRRTMGGKLNDFSETYWNSLSASVWDVLQKYFHFNTEVLPCIDGNAFPLFCALPIGIFCCDYVKKMLKPRLVAMYITFFVTCASWFVLGKAHSCIHTHINFVLWYFGYVQICLYIIIDKIISVFSTKEKRYV